MAYMKPEYIDMFQNENEEKAFDILKTLDDSFTIVYEPSIGVEKSRTPDFIVVSEELGLIVLDVKYVHLDTLSLLIENNKSKIKNLFQTVKDYAYIVQKQLIQELTGNSTIVHQKDDKDLKELTFPNSSGILLFIHDDDSYTKEDVSKILSLKMNEFIILNDKSNNENILSFLQKLDKPFSHKITPLMKDEILKKIYINSNASATEFINSMSYFNISLNKNFTENLNGSHFEKSKQLKKNLIEYTKFTQGTIEIADKNLGLGCSNIIEKLKGYKKELEDEKFTVAIFGYFSTGKSTFLNTLMNTDKLPMDEDRSTATFTRLKHFSESEDFENGDMEVIYKDEIDISISYKESINNLPFDDFKQEKYLEFSKLQEFKDELVSDLKIIKIRDFGSEQRDKIKNSKKVIGYILDNNIPYGTTDKVAKEDIYEFLTDDKKAFGISEVIYYLDNDLLKDIEIVDTPGYGSENTMDTFKTQEFVKEANVLILLTEAKDPMSKEDEHKFLETYESIYNKEDGTVDTNNLFIIANKVDTSIKNVAKIKDSILEKIEDNWEDSLVVDSKQIFTMSSKYHYEKNILNQNPININNVSENDLDIFIDYYSKFLTESKDKEIVKNSFHNIDTTIIELNNMFNDAIQEMNEDIETIQRKKAQFAENKILMKEDYNIYTSAISNITVQLSEDTKKKLDKQKINDVYKITKSYDNFLKSQDKSSDKASKKLSQEFFQKYIKSLYKSTQEENSTLFEKYLETQMVAINRQINKYSLELEAEYGIKGLQKKMTVSRELETKLSNITFDKGVINSIFDVVFLGYFVNSRDYAEKMVKEWEDKYYSEIYTEIQNANNNAIKQILTEFQEQNNDIIRSIGSKLSAIETKLKKRLTDRQEYYDKVKIVEEVLDKINTYKRKISSQENELYGE